MEQTFSRRGFLKGAAAAALAVSAMGLTGCSTDAGAEPSTAVVLGDYKVDVDVRKSTRRSDTRNNKTTGILLPVVYITNQTGSVMELKLTASVFKAAASDGTELKFDSALQPLTLVQKVPASVTPSFWSTDEEVFQKLSSGELSLKLSITLSGQTAVYTMNFGDLTQTVEKI